MIRYEEPDMKVYESSLLSQYRAFAASIICQTGAVQCFGNGGVNCTSDVVTCTSNSAGCGGATYCTTKSS